MLRYHLMTVVYVVFAAIMCPPLIAYRLLVDSNTLEPDTPMNGPSSEN